MIALILSKANANAVEELFLFGTLFLFAAVVVRVLFGTDRRRTSYAPPDPDIRSWKCGKE